MTVAVNPVQRPDNGLDEILKAVQLATSVYGAKLDKDRQAKLDDLAAQRYEQEQIAKAEGAQSDRDFQMKKLATEQAFKSQEADKDRLAKRIELADKKKEENKGLAKQKTEVGYRYNNIIKNANDLKDLVKKEGTMALTGTAGEDMDRAIYNMALDYAKLVDPDSVAREGEVASAQKYMLGFRNLGGATTSNATALKSIDQYVSSLNNRLDAKIQAMESEGQDASSLREVLAKNSKDAPPKFGGSGTALALPKDSVSRPPIKQNGHTYNWNAKTGKYE